MPDQTSSALMSRPVSILFKSKSRLCAAHFEARCQNCSATSPTLVSGTANIWWEKPSNSQLPNSHRQAGKCGGRCGCQLIGGITVFAHYHMLTVLMKARTGGKTAVGNLFCCSALKPTVTACNWCYIKNRLCQVNIIALNHQTG